MNEYEVMLLLNNAVFPTEDIHDKLNELTRNYDFMDVSGAVFDTREESNEYLEHLLTDYPNIHYVVDYVGIDDKFSKLIIRKVK